MMEIKYRLAYLRDKDTFQLTITQQYEYKSITTKMETDDLSDLDPEVADDLIAAFEADEEYEVCAKIKEAIKPKQQVPPLRR